MVNELCELASSGVSVVQAVAFVVAIIGASVVLFVLHKKNKVNVKWILPTLLFVFSLSLTTTRRTVFAQSAEDCMPAQQDGNNPSAPTKSGQPSAIGGLVNDNPVIDFNYINNGPGNPMTFDGAGGNFRVLTNDNAPSGDPFNITTMRLIGDYPDSEYPLNFYILDPNNPFPPTSGDPGDPNNANVWGYWSIDLTCNIGDTMNCASFPDPGGGSHAECISDGTGCWPTGYVTVELYENALPGNYSINYSVVTQSGVPLLPATITVNIPEPGVGTPVVARDGKVYIGVCNPWPIGQVLVDLMNDTNDDNLEYISTSGAGTLLPGTIDLNPMTPEIDSSVTIEDLNSPGNFATLIVDSSGKISITNPSGGEPGTSGVYYFEFNIEDSDGFKSNSGRIELFSNCA